MTKLAEAFKNRKALITFITVGDPNLAATEKLIYQLEKAGADIIELGIPFSDPLADGLVIQASHQRALKNNISLSDVLKLVAKVRRKTKISICFMLSYNLVHKYGVEKFYKEAARVKVDGIIIPDLPPEEALPLSSLCSDISPLIRERKEEGVAQIFLVAPTSTDERIRLIAGKSSGFIYLISDTGLTGKRKKLAEGLKDIIARIRKHSSLPIAVGFGIAQPAQAAEIARLADGVIVGSAIVDLIGKRKIKAVSKFVASLRRAIDAG
ncbi:tryptophan synthase subunit alpha [candidate division WOR-1 bacterium RIFCSPLOWO2_02_FULL_46_20]|uniref:Tryptophan synthase alpha chain n=2 Tax=Saganbacteria TaxID=1703751 RepID=A0A1F4REJ9_UNCSA|nr:MAG: tryptophan synthase subunit alpha [candidate division WOR-1 bacterium RIFCSPHIGHO2_02_FULL_45_12]OGC06602.1 MAG: tryptophan synthase subunit alpha [candidate division WOR-1 bacterium RIFCSPLOWO2_02_FULL_46_20]OGC09594.1 MAG: tryptophan synthase subunit alpha [candidate division WOR-1 bacterium RIFCSPLOWO2_12_FULL_45_9]